MHKSLEKTLSNPENSESLRFFGDNIRSCSKDNQQTNKENVYLKFPKEKRDTRLEKVDCN